LGYFDYDAPVAQDYWSEESRTTRGIGVNGAIDGGLGKHYHRPGGIATASQWAKAAGVDFAEVYKNYTLSDPSIFNFYKQLLDGPNKKEWQNFDTYNISLAQTFFKDTFGFELTYNKENYDNGQLSLLTDSRQAIRVDVMNVHSDGTNAGTGVWPTVAGTPMETWNIPFQDGTPNANVGRAYVTDSGQGGNNSYDSQRESKRATIFFTHDFERDGKGGTLQRILGRHTLTGLLAEDTQETDRRNWQRYAMLDPGWRNFMGLANDVKFNANEFAPSAVIYLGPSLLNASTAAGANLPRVESEIVFPSQITVMAFDSTWGHSLNPASPDYVNPNSSWIDMDNVPAVVEYNDPNTTMTDRSMRFQADNPLNYVGYVPFTTSVTDSEAAPGNRDLLSTNAALSKAQVESKALVWQGHMLDGAIVGTYGYREDTAKSWAYNQDVNGRPAPGHLDLSPGTYRLPDDPGNTIDVTSRALSAVVHLNELPGLSSALEKSPLNISLLYADSTNFQPLASRVDAYGTPIPAPKGDTKEMGVLLESKDGKYTFKINKYKTKVTNAASSALSNAWFIGSSQAWAGNWANHFEFNWSGDNISNAVIVPTEAAFTVDGVLNQVAYDAAVLAYNTNSQWNYGTAQGETTAQALAREAAAVGAWRTWQNSVDPRFYEAWGIDLQKPFTAGAGGIGASTPQGFTVTEDATSEGYEFEFSALPVRNWRLTFNASKSEAVRTNVGGVALAEFINAYDTAVKTTPAGDLRIWWGGAGNETTLFQWNQNVGFEWISKKLQEGSAVPELRKWRFNMITNYDFTEGRLKGVNVGGGLRYQDSVIIGYPPLGSSANFSVDLDNPNRGPSETNLDFWVGYSRRLGDKVDWRIQLNVRNLGESNSLIPVTVQPDGSVAAYRIAPAQTWTVSNTFKF